MDEKEIINNINRLITENEVIKEKIHNLESLLYYSAWFVLLQLVGLFILWVKDLMQKNKHL